MVWLYRFIVFILACFFILPFLNVENPFRSIALRFFSVPGTAQLYQHDCNPDRVYLFSYTLKGTTYFQRYDGYIEALDQVIPEALRCKGAINESVGIQIRYFPYFRYWSEPELAERLSLLLFGMVNLVKFGSVVLLVLTFVRSRVSP